MHARRMFVRKKKKRSKFRIKIYTDPVQAKSKPMFQLSPTDHYLEKILWKLIKILKFILMKKRACLSQIPKMSLQVNDSLEEI